MTQKTLLITGFDPFGGETVNPSREAIKLLPDTVGGYRLHKLEIPVEFGRGAEIAIRAAEELSPDAILCVGLAGGRQAMTPEVLAVNIRDAGSPDNAGYKPSFEPVVPGGREAYFTTLPAREMTAAISAAGLPASLSFSAGVYVCNDLLYSLLHRFAGTEVRVGFIHVPFIPEQGKKGKPSMSLNDIAKGLAAAIEIL